MSAASRASRPTGSSKRNRPSLAMSKQTSSESSPNPTTNSRPLFMEDINIQYASLSERLAQENQAQFSGEVSSSGNNPTNSGNLKKTKVRFAETAALASTLDAARASEEEYRSTPLESISDLFQKKYTVPVFLLAATGIFLMVHLTTGGDGNEVYGSKAQLSHVQSNSLRNGDTSILSLNNGLDEDSPSLVQKRSFNIGTGDGFTSLIFSFVPTPSPKGDGDINDNSPSPTGEAMVHITPKVRAGIPSLMDENSGGYEPGWVLVPTSSKGKGEGMYGGGLDIKEGWGYPPGVPTPDPALLTSEGGNYHAGNFANGVGINGPLNTEFAPDKWGIPAGEPTPDPALLANVSPVTAKWNFPPGYPTPDPIYLPVGTPAELGKGKPGSGLWGYPPGVPTPNPDLLVEVASNPDGSSPTTLKWDIPLGQPTPDPALLSNVDNSSPTTLKWNIPLGQPTPDPALLANVGSPTTLGWNYPPGVPTPDPALLAGVPDTVTWGYPPGVPTPDPALLEGTAVTMTWGYPPGVPTPDPALLSGDTASPTQRNVEVAPPKTSPTAISVSETDVTFKMPDELPPVAPPPADTSGLAVEVAPPPPVPVIPITVKNPSFPIPRPPTPQVVTQTYTGGVYTGSKPDRPGRAPTFLGLGTGTRPPRGPRPVHGQQFTQQLYQQQGGYIMGGCGGCCGGCCGCGGNMMMGGGFMGAVPVSDGSTMVVPQMMGDTRLNLPGGISVPGLHQPECPWECMIDETVPTKGRSNEDDAIYEIFYTNPLNCCGTIVEIGAGNGEDNSPSYFFEYGMNWTAIMTEADPTSFDELTRFRTGDKAALRHGAFCQEGSQIYFDENTKLFQTDTMGDYSSELMSTTAFAVDDNTAKVDCIRLDTDILVGLDHVNVMVIRVKGDPWAVVRTMDWEVSVDIWVILMEDRPGMLHNTLRAALKLHDYVPASWEIKLWCETPTNCMQNEVWLRKSFSALPKPLMGMTGGSSGLRGTNVIG